MQLPAEDGDAAGSCGRPFAIRPGLMADRAVAVLKDFYEHTNPNAPVPKPKLARKA